MNDTIQKLIRVPSVPGRVFSWHLITACSKCGKDATPLSKSGEIAVICECGHEENIGVNEVQFISEVLRA